MNEGMKKKAKCMGEESSVIFGWFDFSDQTAQTPLGLT